MANIVGSLVSVICWGSGVEEGLEATLMGTCQCTHKRAADKLPAVGKGHGRQLRQGRPREFTRRTQVLSAFLLALNFWFLLG